MLSLRGVFAMQLGLWSVEGRMVMLMMMYSTRGEFSLIGGLRKNYKRRRRSVQKQCIFHSNDMFSGCCCHFSLLPTLLKNEK